MKTPEVARESGAARSSLLLRAAVGAVEADGGAAAEKVFEGGFFSVRRDELYNKRAMAL